MHFYKTRYLLICSEVFLNVSYESHLLGVQYRLKDSKRDFTKVQYVCQAMVMHLMVQGVPFCSFICFQHIKRQGFYLKKSTPLQFYLKNNAHHFSTMTVTAENELFDLHVKSRVKYYLSQN